MPPSYQRVVVDLGDRAYPIDIGDGLLSGISTRVQEQFEFRHAIVISDANVAPLYGQTVCDELQRDGIDAHLLTVPAGEESKSVECAKELWQSVLALGTSRKSVVIAAGGGVVGDLGGFIAATFGRGLAFVQVPTTLLAQVDSSVGGKVGINLPGAKNMVGAFWQPRYVAIDISVLKTLPPRELSAGLAEVIKYGVILDEDFFEFLENHTSQIMAGENGPLSQIVARSCRLKADVVEADEREESGRRAILNYGHTFAHAIEAVGGYGVLLHGEAVAIGMLCASRLAVQLGMIPREMTERQFELIRAFGLPTDVPTELNRDDLVDAMYHDKKVEHGELRFILPTRMGHADLIGGVDIKNVRAALE